MKDSDVHTPSDSLRFAATLIEIWETGRNPMTLIDAFAEISVVHDVVLDLMRTNPEFAAVVKERESQLSQVVT